MTASEGSQHWQMVPSGDSYKRTLRDQLWPAAVENAQYKRLPLPSRSSSQAAAMWPSASLTMACNPSRAALGVSLIAIGGDQVRPRSVDRHTIRSPGSLAMALTTMVSPLMATRGPRCRPSSIFGNCATLEGAAKLRPLSSERASQMVSPEPKTSATVPPAAASCGGRVGSVGSTPGKWKPTTPPTITIPYILSHTIAYL